MTTDLSQVSKVNLTLVGVVVMVGLTQLFFTRKQKLKSNQGKTLAKRKKKKKNIYIYIYKVKLEQIEV